MPQASASWIIRFRRIGMRHNWETGMDCCSSCSRLLFSFAGLRSRQHGLRQGRQGTEKGSGDPRPERTVPHPAWQRPFVWCLWWRGMSLPGSGSGVRFGGGSAMLSAGDSGQVCRAEYFQSVSPLKKVKRSEGKTLSLFGEPFQNVQAFFLPLRGGFCIPLASDVAVPRLAFAFLYMLSSLNCASAFPCSASCFRAFRPALCPCAAAFAYH